MARPQKFNAEYFSHGAQERNSKEMRALRSKFGLEGYSIALMLLEHLTDCPHFKFEQTPITLELLSGDFGCSTDLLQNIITYLVTIQFITLSENVITCPVLIDRMQPLIAKREKLRHTPDAEPVNEPENVVRAEFQQQKPEDGSFSSSHNTQSKGEDSKKQKNSVVKRAEGTPRRSLTDGDFILRLHADEFDAFVLEVKKLIAQENQGRPHSPFTWRVKTNSFESDMRSLIYKFNDGRKVQILTEMLNSYNQKMNWSAYVLDAIKITVRKSLTVNMHEPFGFTYKLLERPGEISGHKVDGVLSTAIFPLTQARN